jgi:hypothetical protein
MRGSSCRYAHETPLTNNPFFSGHELRGNAINFSPAPDSVIHPAHPPHEETNQEQISPIAASTDQSDLTPRNVSIDEVTTQVCFYMILQK